MVITAAPFGSVAAVVNVHIQGDRLLLRDCSSWGKVEGADRNREGGRWRDRETGKQRKQKRRRHGWRHDGQADVRNEAVSIGGELSL